MRAERLASADWGVVGSLAQTGKAAPAAVRAVYADGRRSAIPLVPDQLAGDSPSSRAGNQLGPPLDRRQQWIR
jgi:hypothetical protein